MHAELAHWNLWAFTLPLWAYVLMGFCHMGFCPDTCSAGNGTLIPVMEESKFLGLIFDRKLSFISHVKYLKDKCTKALNLLRVIAHTDQQTLLHLYRSLIQFTSKDNTMQLVLQLLTSADI